MKKGFLFLFFTPLFLTAQVSLDSLVYYFQKQDDHKIIMHARNAKLDFEKTEQTNTDGYLTILDILARSYVELQNFKEADLILHQIINARQNRNLNETENQVETLQRLAVLNTKQLNFKKAEEFFILIDSISEKIKIKESSFYANTLRLRAHNFQIQDSFNKAQKLYKQSIKIYNNLPNRYDEDILNSYLDLCDLYIIYESFSEAKELLKLVEELIENNKELNNYYYHKTLDLYSLSYLGENEYKKAFETINKSIILKENEFGKDSESLIESYNILSEINILQNNYEGAESSLLERFRLIKINYGMDHNSYYINLLRLAAFYHEVYPNIDKAAEFILKFSKQFKARLEYVSSFYSNQEMDAFIESNFYFRFFSESFIYSGNQQFPEINLEIFEIESIIKKFKIRNSQLTKRVIESSQNDSLKVLYQEYIETKKSYSKYSEDRNSQNELNKVKNKIEAYEKELSAKTFINKRLILFSEDLFEEIKKELNDDEVIIDLLNYYYFDNTIDDNSRGVMSAFIIKKEYESPKFIKLFEDSRFDSLYSKSKNGINDISKLYNDLELRDLFLSPILGELKNIKNVYFSLSGIGARINITALPIDEFQTFGEKYQVHLIGSSFDFLDLNKIKYDKNLELIAYGDIDYDKGEIGVNDFDIDSIIDVKEDFFAMRTGRRIVKWNYLVGSNDEINQIILKSKLYNFKSTIVRGEYATKSSVLGLNEKDTPFILHLATHGFFFENLKGESSKEKNINRYGNVDEASLYKTSTDPMLRSGLVFSGVNKYWGQPIASTVIDDGILTAKEISNLDLSSCQLVVLSACDTGMGDIIGSEGVYGLQRAFKMAGVKNIIMSLWKIPDAQTAELFEFFYDAFFKGNSIHESLRIAQSKMKEKYSPYYWAGFILLE